MVECAGLIQDRTDRASGGETPRLDGWRERQRPVHHGPSQVVVRHHECQIQQVAELVRIQDGAQSAQEMAEGLVEYALVHGGHDNATVAVAWLP